MAKFAQRSKTVKVWPGSYSSGSLDASSMAKNAQPLKKFGDPI
jgi:hypothetical protein